MLGLRTNRKKWYQCGSLCRTVPERMGGGWVSGFRLGLREGLGKFGEPSWKKPKMTKKFKRSL